MTHLDKVWSEKLEAVASSVVREHAAAVDKEGRFPRAAIDALTKAGFLGLMSGRAVGGEGLGLGAAAQVVERLARECASTAMIVCMHYAGTAVIERYGQEGVRRDIAKGEHLSTLAFSELGSRSQFWAPTSTARREDGRVRLDAKKSWITSATEATAYVWSSRPLEGKEASTLWLVPRATKGVRVDKPFDGLGLRGNDSSPVTAEGALVDEAAMLGKDGGGFGVMMDVVLPIFSVLNAACSIGLMEAAIAKTAAHASATRFEHLGQTIADQSMPRAHLARARVEADAARALWEDTIAALATGRADAMLRVLACKARANDAALAVTDVCMRVGGGAAFRREVGVERAFRDARAGAVMAPTSDTLYDFVGKAVVGLPLF